MSGISPRPEQNTQTEIDLLTALGNLPVDATKAIAKDGATSLTQITSGGGTGSGDVTASADTTSNSIIRGDTPSKGIKNSGVTLDDGDNMSGLTTLGLTRLAPGNWLAMDDGTDTFGLYNNAGTPEAAVTANIGSLGLDTTNGTPYTKTTDSANTGWQSLVAGLYRTIWIDAAACTTRTTNGAQQVTKEYATNDIMVDYYNFDPTTEEAIQCKISMPDEWDKGTILVKFYWAVQGGTGNVVWGVRGGAISNDDAIDAALGTEIEVTDTVTATDDLMISPVSAAVTIGGTPANDDLIWIQIARKSAAGGDTLNSNDAQLLGIKIQYLENASAPAVWS